MFVSDSYSSALTSLLYVGEFGTIIVHHEVGVSNEIIESPISTKPEFISGLGDISSFTHDPRRDRPIDFWYVADM